MSDDNRPQHKSTLHGHVVYCDDEDIRHYFRHLDHDEADMIFDRAKAHGHAEFEVKKHDGSRHNCSMRHHNGYYAVENEGRQNTGW